MGTEDGHSAQRSERDVADNCSIYVWDFGQKGLTPNAALSGSLWVPAGRIVGARGRRRGKP